MGTIAAVNGTPERVGDLGEVSSFLAFHFGVAVGLWEDNVGLLRG